MSKTNSKPIAIKILWRKVLFFGVLGFAIFGTGAYFGITPNSVYYAALGKLQISASENEPVDTMGQSSSNYQIDISVAQNGAVTVNGKRSDTSVQPKGEFDELRYVIFNGNSNTAPYFIDNLKVTVNLPQNITMAQLPEGQRRLITAHGVTETDPSTIINGNQIVFAAKEILPTAIVTVLIELPKGYLQLGATGEATRTVGGIPGWMWLLISIILLVFGLLMMLNIYRKTTGVSLQKPPAQIINQPPTDLSPMMVGVLSHGRIRSKDLLASIIDLANKGYLGIEDKDGMMLVYKRQIKDQNFWSQLKPFEQSIIVEMFGRRSTISTDQKIKEKESKELFSQRITKIYQQVYDEATQLGLFVGNPGTFHFKYKLYAILIFFFGLAGFLYGVFFGADPKFALILWASTMALGLVEIYFSLHITAKSAQGKNELNQWLAFRNYLSLGNRAGLKESQQNAFENYLPFAIAFDVEMEWAGRFTRVDFKKPLWYGSADNILSVQDFANEFFPLVGGFTEKLSHLKEPVID